MNLIDPRRYAAWQPKETLAARPKRIRTERGYSLRKLEECTTISASTLSRIENGHDFNFSVLVVLASYYGMELSDLLSGLSHIELKQVGQE